MMTLLRILELVTAFSAAGYLILRFVRMMKIKRYGRWLPLFLLLSTPSYAYLTDTDVHTEPALPTLAAAGDKINDPTFGTEIIRLTDDDDSAVDCRNGYSNRPAFNVDNTYVQVICSIGGQLRMLVWDWDSSTNTFSNKRQQANRQTSLQDYGVQWSRTTYNKFYACAGRSLYEVTIPDGSSTTWTNTLVRDFATEIGGDSGDYCTQISVSDDDDIFAMHYDIDAVSEGYIAYKRSTNTILLQVDDEGTINEVEIDKSGRYLLSHKNAGSLHIWDLQTGPTRTTVSTEVFNHRGMGSNLVGSQCTSDRICTRTLASPNSVTYILTNVDNAGIHGTHFSMIGPDDWLIVSRFPNPTAGVTFAFDNEIFAVSTTGGGVRRFAHHRMHSFTGDPHPVYANPSMDGRYIAFTSNWDAADTSVPMHVYIADGYPPTGDGTLALFLQWAPLTTGVIWHFRQAILSGLIAVWLMGGAFFSLTAQKTKQLSYQTTLSTVTSFNYVLSRLRKE